MAVILSRLYCNYLSDILTALHDYKCVLFYHSWYVMVFAFATHHEIHDVVVHIIAIASIIFIRVLDVCVFLSMQSNRFYIWEFEESVWCEMMSNVISGTVRITACVCIAVCDELECIKLLHCVYFIALYSHQFSMQRHL